MVFVNHYFTSTSYLTLPNSLYINNLIFKKVDRLPMWLAPNLITLTGFTFLVSANILNMAMNPTFSEDLPNWLYFYSAFCLFLY